MFQGFNEDTIAYLKAIEKVNNKTVYKENETLYYSGVKEPLEQMYYEMLSFFDELDPELCGNKRKCISSAYNDQRFSKDNPIKVYFYLKFKLDKANKKNALGFFFDASCHDYRYGLQIYHCDAAGMERIRDLLLDNKNTALKLINEFNDNSMLTLKGDLFKRDNYPDECDELKEWLNHKNLYFSYEEKINMAFFSREILREMQTEFENMKNIYYLLKEAL